MKAKLDFQSLRRASMSRLYQHNLLLYLRIVPSVLVVICSALIYFLIAENSVHILNDDKDEIFSSLSGINIQVLLVDEMLQLIMDNGTTQARNRPVIEDFLINIETLREVNELIRVFKGKRKMLTAFQEILYNFTCDSCNSTLYYLPDWLQIQMCYENSGGVGRYGLIQGLTEPGNILPNFIAEFEGMEKTAQNINETFHSVGFPLLRFMDVNIVSFLRLYSAVSEDFMKLTSDLKKQGIILASIAVPMIALLGALTWKFVFSKTVQADIKRKKILLMLPAKIILENKYLKKWI